MASIIFDSPPVISSKPEEEDHIKPGTHIIGGVEIVFSPAKEIPKVSWSALDVALKSPPQGWKDVFKAGTMEIAQASEIVESRRKLNEAIIVPQMPNLFKAFQLTPLNQVRVVLVGMDPYTQIRGDRLPRAQGLSFSIERGDLPLPLSLHNIFGALQLNYPDYRKPGHGDLSFWAKQGVLLLNSSLTAEAGREAGIHGQIWFPFLRVVFDAIRKVNPNFIVLLWGRDAGKLRSFIGAKDNRTLTSSHPAARDGSFRAGCRHFFDVNKLLREDGFPPIDWQL